MGLGQGVAFGADLIVELTGQQAAGRGQGVQAETVIGNRLFAGGLEQFRHPTLGGKLGLIAQVLEVHLRRQPVRIGDLEIVVHYLAKQQIQAFPDDSLLFVGVSVPVHNLVAEAATATTDRITENGGTDADTGGVDTIDCHGRRLPENPGQGSARGRRLAGI